MADNIITGRAKKFDGTAIDYVSIFNWSDGKCIAQVVPDAAGNWQYEYSAPLNVGFVYVADGCEPVTHGSYSFAFKGYRYWRIINVITAGSGDTLNAMEGRTLRLINSKGITTNDPSKTISSGGYGADYDPIGAFDDTKNFAAAPDANGDRWIGYDFGVDVIVSLIAVSMHSDSAPVRNWKSVDVEYSDDAVTWAKKGTAYFDIKPYDKTVHTSPIE